MRDLIPDCHSLPFAVPPVLPLIHIVARMCRAMCTTCKLGSRDRNMHGIYVNLAFLLVHY